MSTRTRTRPVPTSKRWAVAAGTSLALAASVAVTPADATGRGDRHERHWPGRPGPNQPACDPDNGGLTLPEGFCATVFADGVDGARHLAVTEHGVVYAAISPFSPAAADGGVVALRDTDGDGRADERASFADRGGNGIDYRDGSLWFAPNDGVLRYDLAPGQLLPVGDPTTIVGGLPIDGDHPVKTVVLGHGDRMYVNIGSGSNSCQVENRTFESPGIDPCPELAVRAGVWRFSAGTAGQEQADGTRIATGARNMNALAVQPLLGALYGVQNGRDQLFENWPDRYTPEDDLVLPAEELFRLRGDADYGWPYCYFDPELGRKVLAPEYGGDGETVGRCESAVDPLVTFPAHWAPLGMHFYRGRQFPREYRGGAFVAFHGSRFAPESQPEGPGYNVSFVPFRWGRATGEWSIFADGFAPDTTDLPASAAHRAVDVTEDRHGSLYISDDKGGRIWKVSYVGGRSWGWPRGG